MIRKTLLFISFFIYSAAYVNAETKDFSLGVNLNSDQYFGFYPTFMGSYKTSDTMDFTFYGILWSAGSFATYNNWTEFGLGVNLRLAEGFSFTPQLGILWGSLLTAQNATRFDGLVPNITAKYSSDFVESEIYAGYYFGIPGRGVGTNHYFHYWVNAGYKVSSFFSLGAHFEHLWHVYKTGFGTGKDAITAKDNNHIILSVAPYIQFADKKTNSFVRLTTGPDFANKEVAPSADKTYNLANMFYKVTVGFNF